MQWEEEQLLEETVERSRMEGNSLKLDVLQQKVPELVVNERMQQDRRVKKTPKKRRQLPGRSTEEMKERPNVAVEEHTKEMKRWKSLNQSEVDLSRKKLAEKMEEEVLDKYKVEESKRGGL